MAVSRLILGLISLIILAGGICLEFFVILSGRYHAPPLDKVYFLQADTTGITGAPNPAHWTFLAVCGARNQKCGKTHAALPFDPPRNFGTEAGVPHQFVGTHHYYYLSRSMFAFFLIALFFAVCALCTSLLALCTRLGAYITGFLTMLALFFHALAAALMTAWTVQGRQAFKSNGQSAKLGRYGYGFTWASVACYLICTVLYCLGGSLSKDRSHKKRLGRKRSTRSRGSFIDADESQHRVKDEYE